jgi:hypothetical protein
MALHLHVPSSSALLPPAGEGSKARHVIYDVKEFLSTRLVSEGDFLP